MTYIELKESHQKQINDFPMFFAFNEEQFLEGKEKLGVKDISELYKISGGGFYRKSDAKKLHELIEKIDSEMQENFKSDEFLFDAMKYEYNNYELMFSNPNEIFEILRIEKTERTISILKKVIQHENKLNPTDTKQKELKMKQNIYIDLPEDFINCSCDELINKINELKKMYPNKKLFFDYKTDKDFVNILAYYEIEKKDNVINTPIETIKGDCLNCRFLRREKSGYYTCLVSAIRNFSIKTVSSSCPIIETEEE